MNPEFAIEFSSLQISKELEIGKTVILKAQFFSHVDGSIQIEYRIPEAFIISNDNSQSQIIKVKAGQIYSNYIVLKLKDVKSCIISVY
jgi:hypothetical protein